jgi:hypothetical protein
MFYYPAPARVLGRNRTKTYGSELSTGLQIFRAMSSVTFPKMVCGRTRRRKRDSANDGRYEPLLSRKKSFLGKFGHEKRVLP